MPFAVILAENQEEIRPGVGLREIGIAVLLATALVLLTRLPLARPDPFESDEFGFLERIAQYHMPIHHTLFLAMARVIGDFLGDPYRGFILLDIGISALALVSIWWWLRAIVRPATAVAATMVLAFAPTFWTYGAMAGNYNAIPLVGGVLLGVAVRTWQEPQKWHPYAAAAMLAFGTGYRQDIGTFWLPILFLILWRHRWKSAAAAIGLFTILNLAWLIPMLIEVGGWGQYRAQSAEFAHSSGFRNSIFYLGLKDATVRYALKLGMALLWTFGLGLMAIPVGIHRIFDARRGRFLASLLVLSVVPALAFHLLIHFGVPGYSFYYVPALLALLAIGVGKAHASQWYRRPTVQLAGITAVSALVFLIYVPNYEDVGARGSFDLSLGRFSRVGLVKRPPDRHPTVWRTANSISLRKSTGLE